MVPASKKMEMMVSGRERPQGLRGDLNVCPNAAGAHHPSLSGGGLFRSR